MYSHVACDVMKERTLYLLKPSSLIWHLMPYLFLFIMAKVSEMPKHVDLSIKSHHNHCLLLVPFTPDIPDLLSIYLHYIILDK